MTCKPRALICYNDSLWHKGSIKQVIWAKKLESDGFDIETVSNTLPLCDSKLLNELDLLILSWSEEYILREQAFNLINAIGYGGLGLAGYHEMSTAFRQYDWHFMLGCFMATHPGTDKTHYQHDYTVHVCAPDDPIMKEIGDFTHHSEQFYLLYDGNNLKEILADTVITDCEYPWINGLNSPVAYKRQFGKGRIFYSALGHHPEEFEKKEISQITHRGMLWASRRLPEGITIESAK
jgi:type 1 glutamine amidotransferase